MPCGWPGPSAVNVRVLPSALHASPLTTLPGSGDTRRCPPVTRSWTTSSDMPPRRFHSTAAVPPVAVTANDSTSAVSEAARTSAVPSRVRISTGNSPASLRAYTVRPSGPNTACSPLVTYSSIPVSRSRTVMCRLPRGPCRSSARRPSGLTSKSEISSSSAITRRSPVTASTSSAVVRFSVTASSDRPGSQRMLSAESAPKPATWCRPEPSGRTSQISWRGAPPGAIWQASQPPPVDQCTAMTGCSPVSTRKVSSLPTGCTQTLGVPLRSETYAACRPSGESAGDQLPETSEGRDPVLRFVQPTGSTVTSTRLN